VLLCELMHALIQAASRRGCLDYDRPNVEELVRELAKIAEKAGLDLHSKGHTASNWKCNGELYSWQSVRRKKMSGKCFIYFVAVAARMIAWITGGFGRAFKGSYQNQT
jgi:hypothetical protein